MEIKHRREDKIEELYHKIQPKKKKELGKRRKKIRKLENQSKWLSNWTKGTPDKTISENEVEKILKEVKRQNSEGKYFQPTFISKKKKKSLLGKKGIHQNEEVKEERGKQEIKKPEDLRVSLEYLMDENALRGNSHICHRVWV